MNSYVSKYKTIMHVHSKLGSGAVEKKKCRNRELSLCIGNGSWNAPRRFKDVTVWITDSSTCGISHPTLN